VMAKRDTTLEAMARNPAGDWTMKHIEAVCRSHGIRCTPPSGGGSHFKVSHSVSRDILTIPARRPIKPVYIRRLVALVREALAGEGKR